MDEEVRALTADVKFAFRTARLQWSRLRRLRTRIRFLMHLQRGAWFLRTWDYVLLCCSVACVCLKDAQALRGPCNAKVYVRIMDQIQALGAKHSKSLSGV